jgi:hypothetical protein
MSSHRITINIYTVGGFEGQICLYILFSGCIISIGRLVLLMAHDHWKYDFLPKVCLY